MTTANVAALEIFAPMLQDSDAIHTSGLEIFVPMLTDSGGIFVSTAEIFVPMLRIPDPVVGYRARVDGGSWGGSPSSFAYRWFRHASAEDPTGAEIVGATKASYLFAAEDSGLWISCEITPSNVSGSGTPVRSNIVGPVAPT